MASGRPDYFQRASVVQAVLGDDQLPWRETGNYAGTGSNVVIEYEVPSTQELQLMYVGFSAWYPGLIYFYVGVDEVPVVNGYYDVQRDLLFGSNVGLRVLGGQKLEVYLSNTMDYYNVLHANVIGFVQNI